MTDRFLTFRRLHYCDLSFFNFAAPTTVTGRFRILKLVLLSDDDRLIYVYMGGLTSLSEAFSVIHGMYHEATACHVLTDLCDCQSLLLDLLRVVVAADHLSDDSTTRKSTADNERCLVLYHI